MFGENEIIVSKTDTKGKITYANDVFLRVAGYTEAEVIGQPHNLIRHPDMPRGVFKLLWDIPENGGEIFAYVKNLAKDGSYYWVLAHVTTTIDAAGRVIGYHSNRRLPRAGAVKEIVGIYDLMRAAEAKHSNAKVAAEAGVEALNRILDDRGITYDEYVWDLITRGETVR